jgi:hypothetical protein
LQKKEREVKSLGKEDERGRKDMLKKSEGKGEGIGCGKVGEGGDHRSRKRQVERKWGDSDKKGTKWEWYGRVVQRNRKESGG